MWGKSHVWQLTHNNPISDNTILTRSHFLWTLTSFQACWKFAGEKNGRQSLSDVAQQQDTVSAFAVIPPHHSYGALNTLKKSKKLNRDSVSQPLTYRVIWIYHGKCAAFPTGLKCPTAGKCRVHADCRLCPRWRAKPPEYGDGIVLTESQICLPCHFQCSCDFALMADAKLNWYIYTFLYMYFLCDSRWD